METIDLNLVFCSTAKKYGIERALLKAVAVVESSLNPTAFRHEPDFWKNVLMKMPEWKDRDPMEVSSSYGLMQLMYTTAWGLGFRGSVEELYNPVYNIELGAKLLRQLMDGIKPGSHFKCWPQEIILARYNGGSKGNPGPDGGLRNYQYTRKVLQAYWSIREKETDCDKA